MLLEALPALQLPGVVPMADRNASKFHQISDSLWQRVEPLLPVYKRSCKGGRPRLPLRKIVTGILYVLRTGCQWKAMPSEFGSGSAIHSYFQEWVQLGVFERLWQHALEEYDEMKGIDWRWQSLDGAMTKAPLGGGKNREKSDGSWQTGRQTIRVDRGARRARRGRRLRRQCA